MQGAAALGGASGMFGTAMNAIGTAGTIYSMVGPQSPFVTGDVAGMAKGVQGIQQGINNFTKPDDIAAQNGPKIDVPTMMKAQPNEIASLPQDIRHQILAAMMKDIK